jgi:hypothetical protein
MAENVEQHDHPDIPPEELLRFRKADGTILVVCTILGSTLALAWLQTTLTWVSPEAPAISQVAIRPLTMAVFAGNLSLLCVLLSQYFSGRRSLSFGEWCWVVPILFLALVACVPDLGTFGLWVLATFLCGLCGLIHFAVRVFQPQCVARQWTNWFGSLTCFLNAVWLWLSLTLQPLML